MEVSSTPCTPNDCPDDFWEPYVNEEYDSSSSEQDYFPTDDDSLLWHMDESTVDSKDFGMIVDFSEWRNVTCVHVPVTVYRSR